MAVFAVRIRKSTLFEGSTREFGNTYHYKTSALEPFQDLAVATALKNQERLVMASDVTFLGWETWGPTDGSQFNNVMRESGVFNENGQGINTPAMYKEVAAVVAWPLPRSPSTNRKRWCRKFIRIPGNGTSQVNQAQAEGESPLSGAQLTALEAYGSAVRSITANALTVQLCTDDGTETTGAAQVRPFLKTREIGR